MAYGVQIGGKKSQNIYVDEANGGEVIICGGAVNSPHLLMLSGIGDAEELQQHGIQSVVNVPGVGMQCASSHPICQQQSTRCI